MIRIFVLVIVTLQFINLFFGGPSTLASNPLSSLSLVRRCYRANLDATGRFHRKYLRHNLKKLCGGFLADKTGEKGYDMLNRIGSNVTLVGFVKDSPTPVTDNQGSKEPNRWNIHLALSGPNMPIGKSCVVEVIGKVGEKARMYLTSGCHVKISGRVIKNLNVRADTFEIFPDTPDSTAENPSNKRAFMRGSLRNSSPMKTEGNQTDVTSQTKNEQRIESTFRKGSLRKNDTEIKTNSNVPKPVEFVKGSLKSSSRPSFQKGPIRANTATDNGGHDTQRWSDTDSAKENRKREEVDEEGRPDGMDSEEWAFEQVLRDAKGGKPMEPIHVPTKSRIDDVLPGELCRLQLGKV